jgi:lipid A 3-O-deacylase
MGTLRGMGRGALLAGLVMLGGVAPAWAQAADNAATRDGPLAASEVPPAQREGWFDGFFVQRGVGEEVEAFTVGGVRHLPVSWLGNRAGLYGEVSISRWEARPRAPRDTGTLVQLAFKPVLRYELIPASVTTFVELGIGLTISSEVYRKADRQFSTAFNFGDHLALGWAFGERHQHEVVLRVEHFSNGNIRLPNPGENFRELRYMHWF